MYLKVEFDGESEFYAFENQSAVAIGRGPENDVQVFAEGVSRNHIIIKDENGEYTFEDTGSTNGTFVNGQQIEPGSVKPFNSFFPLKLGANVYVHLIDEVTARNMLNEGVVPVNKQNSLFEEERKKRLEAAARTESIHVPKKNAQNFNQTRVIKRKSIAMVSESSEAQSSFSKSGMLVLFGVIASVIYLMPGEDKTIPEIKNRTLQVSKVAAPVEKMDMLTADEAKGIISLDKCLGDFEAKLCSPLKKQRSLSYNEGFLKLANKLYLVVDYSKVIKHYSSVSYDEDEKEKVNMLLRQMLGRSFSADSFAQNDYKHEDLELDSINEKYASMFTDIVTIKSPNLILSHSGIDEFFIILFNENPVNYYGHAKVDPETLKTISSNENAAFDFKIFWRSGFKAPAGAFLGQLKGVDLKGF